MDAVNAFNLELFSMLDMKPPISRAKMMSVTKSAIKAIKLYKHVVQIVEKFIKKCKPDLKVPGLYVVDSIVRQSRHQFGVDKDVFGPRFLKNFTETFHNLYCCPEEDKSKIIRVLNLWQKNGVFEMDIIQPLMDMDNGPVVAAAAVEVLPEPVRSESQITCAPSGPVLPAAQMDNVEALATVAQLFQSPQGQELQRLLQNLQQGNQTLAAAIENNLPNPAQFSVNAHNSHTESKHSLTEKLLDRFEYDDEPEDTAKENHAQLLSIAESVLKQFAGQLPNAQSVLPYMMDQTSGIQHEGGVLNHDITEAVPDGYSTVAEPYTREPLRDSPVRRDSRQRGYGRKSRSRSNSRSPRRRRSRSSSHSRRSGHRNSRSRERHRRSHSMDRSDRERERERRQKGLPSIKSHTLSVCSTTLWVGQLDKKTQQSDIMSLLEEFGQIESINMIPPRGCAYIVMVHRQDANTALNKLSRGSFRVNQKPFKIAWALNKGIKSAHKKFWDVDRGVTYIPWNKVKVDELEGYRDGGMIDADTINTDWGIPQDFFNKQTAADVAVETTQTADGAVTGPVQVPPVQQAVPMGSPPASVLVSPTSVPTEAVSVIPQDHVNTPAATLKSPRASSVDPTLLENPLSDTDIDNNLGSPRAPPPMIPGPFPGMPPPGMPPFMSPPHMPPPPMGRPMMFPPDRFGMPMPFPPRGPPFPRPGMDIGPYRNGRPGFGTPPFPRGRW